MTEYPTIPARGAEAKIFRQRKSALITGASGEIGSAIAARLAELDYRLIVVGRHGSALEHTADDIAGRAPEINISMEICDVADDESVSKLFTRPAVASASVQVLVNAAGILAAGATAALEPRRWRDVIATNLDGTFFVTREALSRKLIPPGGRIINIAAAGDAATFFGASYAASKYGVIGFTRALALELAATRCGITVNAVCPGFVETAMSRTLRKTYAEQWQISDDEVKSQLAARVPLGRYVTPFEVADMVAYLASPGAAALTGQAFNVSGGLGT